MLSKWIMPIEALFFFAIVTLGYAGHVPTSSAPWLLLIAALSFKIRIQTWQNVGPHTNTLKLDILLGTILGITLQTFGTFIQEPFFDWLTQSHQDISQFEGVRQSLGLIILMIALSWLLAGFGEEMVYRGYLLTRVTEICGNGRTATFIGLIFSSLIFALAHKYQGISGILDSGLMGFYYGLIYLLSGKRLYVAIFTHGVNNTLGFIFLYLGFYDHLLY
jgi:hypothetical protein